MTIEHQLCTTSVTHAYLGLETEGNNRERIYVSTNLPWSSSDGKGWTDRNRKMMEDNNK
jgi:hypothetical protein